MHQGVRRAHMALHQVLIGGDAMSQGSVTNACSGRPSMRNLQGCCVQSGGSRPPGTGHGQARNATATSAARCRRWRRAAASASACSGFRHRSQCEPRLPAHAIIHATHRSVTAFVCALCCAERSRAAASMCWWPRPRTVQRCSDGAAVERPEWGRVQRQRYQIVATAVQRLSCGL